ncbi:MAG: hypothetical protein MUE44_35195 [Oscillatoriaceae cyanobacterium Prado104]|nr:hypothetical protein [Oscillatoriaceae cyanobacterium Prado104]
MKKPDPIAGNRSIGVSANLLPAVTVARLTFPRSRRVRGGARRRYRLLEKPIFLVGNALKTPPFDRASLYVIKIALRTLIAPTPTLAEQIAQQVSLRLAKCLLRSISNNQLFPEMPKI